MSNKSGQYQGCYIERSPGRWEGRIRLGWKDGKRQRLSFYGKTRLEVQGKVADAVRAFQNDGIVKVERQTVGKFLDRWLEESAKSTLRPRTFISYRQIIDQHIKPGIGHVELSKLTPQHVQAFLNEKQKAPIKRQPKSKKDEPPKPVKVLSTRTVLYIRAILRKALNQALRWSMVTRNVAALVDPPKAERIEIKPLDVDGAKAFLKATEGQQYEALFRIGLAVGLRLGEVLGLRWQDVDLQEGTIRVAYQLQKIDDEYRLVEPKSRKSKRIIPMPKLVMDALTDHRLKQEFQERPAAGEKWQSWGLVFMNEIGAPLDERKVRQAFYEILEKAKLPRVRFHDLRHTCASLLLAQGVPARVVMEVLGHSQVSLTLDTYTHVSGMVLQDAANKMTAVLDTTTPTDRTTTFTTTGTDGNG